MSFITYGELLKGVNGSQNREKSLSAIARLTKKSAWFIPMKTSALITANGRTHSNAKARS